MAVLMTISCPICGETKQECRQNGDYTPECGDCQQKEADRKRREFLAGRAALSIEERLAIIEAGLYDSRRSTIINNYSTY